MIPKPLCESPNAGAVWMSIVLLTVTHMTRIKIFAIAWIAKPTILGVRLRSTWASNYLTLRWVPRLHCILTVRLALLGYPSAWHFQYYTHTRMQHQCWHLKCAIPDSASLASWPIRYSTALLQCLYWGASLLSANHVVKWKLQSFSA